MSVRRVMGSETEFGVLSPQDPNANSTVLSTRVVTGYAVLVARELAARKERQVSPGTGWDYGSESPLSDARGFNMEREQAHPSQLTDEEPVLTAEQIAAETLEESSLYAEDIDWRRVIMNTVIPNGARVYVDHSHPEYASPEVTSPRDALIWDLAGDVVAARAVDYLAESAQRHGSAPVNLYKNNTDNKSVSYGSHENYLVDRSVPFERFTAGLLPFFASRQIMCGAGRVGIGRDGAVPGFQLSQRADFFERTVGLETTVRRPIVNTRDEPHADDTEHRRLHVIIGDANLSHTATLLKFGTTSLVLNLIEHGRAPAVELVDPVAALHAISHDPTVRATVRLKDGRELTGIQLQREYLREASALEHELAPEGLDTDTREILDLWEEILNQLEENPLQLADRLDWVAKYALICAYQRRDGLTWDDPRLIAIDLQYSDIRPAKGLYHRLVAGGRMRTLVDAQTIERAAGHPPEDTRAWFRGSAVTHFPEAMESVGWDSVNVTLPGIRRSARIAMPQPLDLTRDISENWFAADDVSDWLATVARNRPRAVTGPGGQPVSQVKTTRGAI